ncbi:MAG: ion channel [Phototrophicaceae bacterium]
MRDTIRSLAEGNKIAFLLSSIFLLSIGYPLAEMGDIAALVYLGIYIVVVCSFIYLVSGSRVLLVVNILLAVVITLLALINIINDPAPLVLAVAWNISGLLQQFLIVALLVAFIIESEVVTRQVLYAGVAIYFSMATFFATLYNLIELMSPGAFLASTGAAITPTNLTYFSLVTLSTLGYGDIIPVAPVAQSLAVLQASVGTLYIAILIGRFVSLYQHDAA